MDNDYVIVILGFVLILVFVMYVYYETQISDLERQLDTAQAEQVYWAASYYSCSANEDSCISQLKVCESVKAWCLGLNQTQEDCNCDYTCTWTSPDCYEYSFQRIAEQVANAHDYVAGSYVCVNYSKDLVNALQEKGWQAEVKYGFYHNDTETTWDSTGHSWVIVQVPIESTTGQIIEPNYYKEHYKFGW